MSRFFLAFLLSCAPAGGQETDPPALPVSAAGPEEIGGSEVGTPRDSAATATVLPSPPEAEEAPTLPGVAAPPSLERQMSRIEALQEKIAKAVQDLEKRDEEAEAARTPVKEDAPADVPSAEQEEVTLDGVDAEVPAGEVVPAETSKEN